MKLVRITNRPKVWFLKKGGAFSETHKDREYDLYSIVGEKMVLLSALRDVSKNIKNSANEQFKKYLGR